ncbi:manganese-dependent inorganic pyrophosphatase [Candidatus Margulisiibacteriota bacterium]
MPINISPFSISSSVKIPQNSKKAADAGPKIISSKLSIISPPQTQKSLKITPVSIIKKPKTIYVVGHKNPDADSVCSAIGYVQLRKYKGYDNYIPLIAGPVNKETAFILRKFNYPVPEIADDLKGKRVILVDHNNHSQSPKGVERKNIIKIIDHHKLCPTSLPVYIKAKPVGSTATILANKMLKRRIKNRNLAGLLISAIISDTVGFTSATTTEKDKEIAQKLAKKSNINLDKLTKEILKAKTDIKGLSPERLLTKDGKEIKIGNKKIYIGQIEVADDDQINPMLNAKLRGAMHRLEQAHNYDGAIIMKSNITNGMTRLVPTEKIKDFCIKAFQVNNDDDEIGIKGISRKRNVVPILQKHELSSFRKISY